MGVPGAQYGDFAEVDMQMSVSAFKGRYVAEEKLDVRPSFVTLRLVLCDSRKPTAEEEAAAVVLDDPSLTLDAVGVTGTAWLLAFVAKSGSVADVPTRVLTVTSRARGKQQKSEWHVSKQADLNLHLAHGLLWLTDSGGKLVRSVVMLSELSADPSATYHFQLTTEGHLETATATIANLASGTERESTLGIANDELVQQVFGPVTILLGGEPVLFSDDDQPVLEADGLLGTKNFAWVLLISAKLTAGKGDVYEALNSSLKLHDLLRSDTCGGKASVLAPYSNARVHAFLSASHFLPGVKELAVQKGVTLVECSGARYHVPHIAAESLQ